MASVGADVVGANGVDSEGTGFVKVQVLFLAESFPILDFILHLASQLRSSVTIDVCLLITDCLQVEGGIFDATRVFNVT